MNISNKKSAFGFSMIELMIALVISSISVIAFVSMFATQNSMVATQARRAQAEEEGREVHQFILNLLRTSSFTSISIAQNGNSTTINFALPSGLSIWPNTTPPYTDNFVRINWANFGNNSEQILISNAVSFVGLGGAVPTVLAGSNNSMNSRITGMTLTNQGNGTYLFTLTTTTGAGSGTNPANSVFASTFIPRN